MIISYTDIKALNDFEKELCALEDWLEKSFKYLEEVSEDAEVNDVKTTEFKLEQIRSLTSEIESTKPSIEKLQTCTNLLLENSEPKFAGVLNSRLEAVSHKWNAIIDGAKLHGDKFEHALKKNDEVCHHSTKIITMNIHGPKSIPSE